MSLMRGFRCNRMGWMVWIAINNHTLNPSQWLGTYMFCADDGAVTRVTINADGTEDEFTIKDPDRLTDDHHR